MEVILLQAASDQPIDISRGRKRINGLQKEMSLRQAQPHFAGCDNIPNNAIWEKQRESGRSMRVGFELHFDNYNIKNTSKKRDIRSGWAQQPPLSHQSWRTKTI